MMSEVLTKEWEISGMKGGTELERREGGRALKICGKSLTLFPVCLELYGN